MHRLPRIVSVLALLIICNSAPLYAQSIDAAESHPVDTVRTRIDTGGFQMAKSPLTAVLLSAALPGAGQVYVGQWWKLPFVYGVIGGFFYGEQIQNLRYHQAQHTIDSLNAIGNPDNAGWISTWENSREFYRDDRDKFWIYLGITYIAVILDAYIASHLYDFDVSDPAPSVSSYYNPIDKQVGMSFHTRF